MRRVGGNLSGRGSISPGEAMIQCYAGGMDKSPYEVRGSLSPSGERVGERCKPKPPSPLQGRGLGRGAREAVLPRLQLPQNRGLRLVDRMDLDRQLVDGGQRLVGGAGREINVSAVKSEAIHIDPAVFVIFTASQVLNCPTGPVP